MTIPTSLKHVREPNGEPCNADACGRRRSGANAIKRLTHCSALIGFLYSPYLRWALIPTGRNIQIGRLD
jgi:hypothetical protein